MSPPFSLSLSPCTFQALGSWSNCVYRLFCRLLWVRGRVCVRFHRGLRVPWACTFTGSSAAPVCTQMCTLVCTCVVCVHTVCPGMDVRVCIMYVLLCPHMDVCVSLSLCIGVCVCVCTPCVCVWICECLMSVYPLCLCMDMHVCVYPGCSCLNVCVPFVLIYGCVCVCARVVCLCLETRVPLSCLCVAMVRTLCVCMGGVYVWPEYAYSAGQVCGGGLDSRV